MEPNLTPKLVTYIVAEDARGLIRFIEKGIGGRLSFEISTPEGRLAHAEVSVADSFVMIGEKPAGHDPFPAMLHLYVNDAYGSYRRALDGGAKSVREPGAGGDGLVRGGVRDAWGNEWWFSSPARST
jgi:PhnB protein